jgi:NADH:ubiquinone oxidoreductase subunit 5 (subunit L)/multisubunit Na+/H+ antiporter MnhA subunit
MDLKVDSQTLLVDQGVQTDTQVQTEGIDVKNSESKWWRRVRLAMCLLKYLVFAGLCIGGYHQILSKFPSIRTVLLDEHTEEIRPTEREQSVLWVSVFVPVVSMFCTLCRAIYFLLKLNPTVWKKIAEWTSLWFFGTWIAKKMLNIAIVEPCKKVGKALLLFFVKCSIGGICASLMFIGLRSVLKHYNVHGQMQVLISCVGAAIPPF